MLASTTKTTPKITISKEPWIGGPNTCLPRIIESMLAWILALSCLSVSGYYYIKQRFFSIHKQKQMILLPPLMTCSNEEMEYKSVEERYKELVYLIRHLLLVQEQNDGNIIITNAIEGEKKSSIDSLSSQEDEDEYINISDDDLVNLIRTNSTLRRLVTLTVPQLYKKYNDQQQQEECTSMPVLLEQIVRIWSQLLPLPEMQPLNMYKYDIALIIPCYCESMDNIYQKLHVAYTNCTNPTKVQVIIVLATRSGDDENSDNDNIDNSNNDKKYKFDNWGNVQIVQYKSDNNNNNKFGRGPCMNYGASYANDAAIYTFCHSDTILPKQWNISIIQTLYDNNNRISCCAFQFGIDKSTYNSNNSNNNNKSQPPPGLNAVEYTANIRCKLYTLPYGDQCISIISNNFHYVGGYPNQSFMEDYEFILFLRQRQQSNIEQISIIKRPSVLCSPRRWEKYGVIYVTYINSKLVHLYTSNSITSDQMYNLYYNNNDSCNNNNNKTKTI